LKGIAAYVGDKALGGIIGGAAVGAAGALVGRLTIPAPVQPVMTTIKVVKSITLVAKESLPLSDHLAIKPIRGNNGTA
jgi:hypothetical protein